MRRYEDSSSEALMALYAANDSDAFDELYRRYEKKIFGFMRARVQDENLARDLFQEFFKRLHEFRDRYDAQLRLDPWLFTVARNIVISAQRKQSRSKEIAEEEIEEVGQFTDDPVELKIWIMEQVRALPPLERDILCRRYLNDEGYDEIARATKKTESSVRKIVSRALIKLRGTLGV